jgi:hypothetical protein
LALALVSGTVNLRSFLAWAIKVEVLLLLSLCGLCSLFLNFMKLSFSFSPLLSVATFALVLSSSLSLVAAENSEKQAKKPEKTAPKKATGTVLLSEYLTKDKPVMGEVGAIVPPKEINKYIAKVQVASKENPEWYAEYAKKSKPGLPLPWHEKLGLTKDEYAEYLKLWDQRQFKPVQKVVLRLEEPSPGEWMIRVSGVGMQISLLRYYPETDQFKSTNGVMKRIEDINANKRSILGAWKGQEWRFEEKTEYVWTKENIAIGKYNDHSACLLIYRIQESVTGYDKSIVIRFAHPKTKKK